VVGSTPLRLKLSVQNDDPRLHSFNLLAALAIVQHALPSGKCSFRQLHPAGVTISIRELRRLTPDKGQVQDCVAVAHLRGDWQPHCPASVFWSENMAFSAEALLLPFALEQLVRRQIPRGFAPMFSAVRRNYLVG
jgi:hypothetical protein